MQLLEGNLNNFSNFSGKDSHERLVTNLKEQPDDWAWRNKPVHYTLNSQRYRALEWKDYNWSDSILVFGCSMIYGVGVDDCETLPHYLSILTGHPCINLGMGGSGVMFHLANSIILKEHNITPRTVIYVWPDRSRQTEFQNDKLVVNHGLWDAEKSNMKDVMINDTHTKYWANYLIRNIRLLWECPVIEASWYDDMCEITGACKLHFKDYARDCAHPGPKTLKHSAELIATQLV